MPDTLADRLAVLNARHDAEWTRTPQDDGSVVMRLHCKSGDVIAGRGATTADAVADLEQRAALMFPTSTEA